MAKRPSYVSIRARQRNIIEGIGTGNMTYAQAARRLGVPESDLKKFVTTKPKAIRSTYNRHPTYSKLYGDRAARVQRAQVRSELGLHRINRYPYEENELRRFDFLPGRGELAKQRSKQVARQVQFLYYRNNVDAQDWSQTTFEGGLPNNPHLIGRMAQRGEISNTELSRIMRRFKRDYPRAKNIPSLFR